MEAISVPSPPVGILTGKSWQKNCSGNITHKLAGKDCSKRFMSIDNISNGIMKKRNSPNISDKDKKGGKCEKKRIINFLKSFPTVANHADKDNI